MKILLIILGVALILFGLATIILPLPTGIISLIVGIALLATVSRTFRRFVKWLRRKFRPLDTVLDKAEETLPDQLSKPLQQTDPDLDDDEDEDAETPPEPKTVTLSPASYIRRLPRHPTYRR